MKGRLSKETSDFKMSLNIFTNPQERLNLIKFRPNLHNCYWVAECYHIHRFWFGSNHCSNITSQFSRRTLTFDSGPAIVHLMLADVRNFAKAERELVERDAVWTSISSVRGSRVV